jgi:hypothetical protein
MKFKYLSSYMVRARKGKRAKNSASFLAGNAE